MQPETNNDKEKDKKMVSEDSEHYFYTKTASIIVSCIFVSIIVNSIFINSY